MTVLAQANMPDLSKVQETADSAVVLADGAFMLIAAAIVLLMTPALALFYGGMSRQKSVLNMMMMSFGAIAVVSLVFVLWGWSMAFGSDDLGGVIANPFTEFALHGAVIASDGSFLAGANGYPMIIDVAFQVTFVIITVALISGALAERVKFTTWLLFVALWTTVVYFPLAHMVWGGGLLSGSENGFAAKIFGTVSDGDGGLVAAIAPVDFAGGTVVEINSGVAGLVLALIVGHRHGFGRTAYRPHNLPFVMLGAGMLWFGWFAFNAGSAFSATGQAGLAWINTLVAGSAGMLFFILVERIRDGHLTSFGAASGIVAGLVAITPSCGSVSPLGAIAIGAGAGVFSALAIGLKHTLGYDDSLDVVGVHMVGGLWGTIAIGFFATGTFGTAPGVLYSAEGWKLLLVQVLLALAALVFAGLATVLVALILKPIGWRVERADEAAGIDETHHAETAYDSGAGIFS